MTHHHKLIKSLVAEIRELRNQIDNGNYNESYEYETSFYERKNKLLREENERISKQIENERREQQSREWERERLMKEIEKREKWGDDWGADRYKRQLRNL